MTKEKELNLKMELLDTISEEQKSLDITGMWIEVSAIFAYFKQYAISDIKSVNDFFIELSMKSAITSYRMVPEISLEYRISIINGINFTISFLADYQDDKDFKNLTLEQKISKAKYEYQIEQEKNDIYDIGDMLYAEFGISNMLQSIYSDNKNPKQK